MTSLSRKKLQITVRNLLCYPITKSTSILHPALLGSALFGLMTASQGVGQQPPGWSPQPYTKPNLEAPTSQQDFVPPNRLRLNEGQQNGDVVRWSMGNKTQPSEKVDKSFAQALRPQRELPLGNNVQLASHNEISVESPTPVKRTNGVWYDRSVANDNATRMNDVQKARFQAPSPPPLFLPQAIPPTKNSQESNSIREAIDPLPSSPQVQQKRPGNSLLKEPEEIPASPFPGSKTPKQDGSVLSPSDSKEPPSIKSPKDSDPAPRPPRKDKSSADCDAVRLLAKDLDITKLRIDSSPDFVKGIPNPNRPSANTKDNFIANAAFRSWLSHDGAVVAEGKLVDLRLGSVILEKADGTRTSYLLYKLSDADQAYVSENWGLPVTCSIDDRSFPRRDFVDTTVTWKASGACHKPLYFEDVQLERYGHEWGPFAQPVMSTAHFFGDVIVLPYKMGIHPPNECQYSLGYYRPGSCAPWTVGPVPISLRGALLQAQVITGAALVLP